MCSFRYGREEDETLGLSFKKELTLADEQVGQIFAALKRKYRYTSKSCLIFF